jgi:excinuclease ABC subunit A
MSPAAERRAVHARRQHLATLGDLQEIRVVNATGNNLKNVSVAFPWAAHLRDRRVGLGQIDAGERHAVRGRGAHALPLARRAGRTRRSKASSISTRSSTSTSRPIGRTPRSNPATYTGLFTPIRELMAEMPTARERGYGPGRFSFNVAGGRCEACQGDGVVKVEMHFLPDVYVPCEVCHGQRYNRETLEVQYKGKNIAQILDMTVEVATPSSSAVPTHRAQAAHAAGRGPELHQARPVATTLSGGEAQRVKLALELSKRDTGRTLYILDEPTTGLHFADIELLLKVLHQLRDAGNTIVVIEHNLDVIKTADWLIDMGPEGGAGGGTVVGEGTPEDIAANEASHTGRYLQRLLGR